MMIFDKILGRFIPKTPRGVLIYELGQEPLFGLWYCTLYDLTTQQAHQSIEHDTPRQAVQAALRQRQNASPAEEKETETVCTEEVGQHVNSGSHTGAS